MKNKRKAMLWTTLSALTATVLLGCNNKSEVSSPKTEPPPAEPANPDLPLTDGIWQSKAYGMILEFEGDTHRLYQFTSDYCQLGDYGLDSKALLESVLVSDDGKSMETSFTGLKVPGIVMTKESYLPDNCAHNLIPNKGHSAYEYNPQQEFEIFWQTFNEHYAFFHLEGVDWDEIYQLANSHISDNTSEEELFDIFSSMVAPLKDFHVFLENEVQDLEFSTERKTSNADIALAEYLEINQLHPPLSFEEILAFEAYLQDAEDLSFDIIQSYFAADTDVKVNDSDTMVWAMLENNIAYLNLSTMDIAEIAEDGNTIAENRKIFDKILDELVEDLKDAKGIIIDLRYNQGGDDFVGQMIAQRFFSARSHFYSKQARLGEGRTPLQTVYVEPKGETILDKPTVVLTSSSTASAAETFALGMREHSKVVLIGEATAGGLSDTLPKSLPHGMTYTLSNEFYLSAEGVSYEGEGVPVDIEQAFFRRAQLDAGIDGGIEKAREWIMAQ
ncbi:S41 family peptidase [Agaribacter flavus]|uniref:S41 family peptidase n=1 Tax=Agaribacter flavus TaxID=1902781 RepID=A0ABV7FQZ2_9ALTE